MRYTNVSQRKTYLATKLTLLLKAFLTFSLPYIYKGVYNGNPKLVVKEKHRKHKAFIY